MLQATRDRAEQLDVELSAERERTAELAADLDSSNQCAGHIGPLLRARKYLTVTVAYGTCTMPIWLTTTCPKTLILTLRDVLESGNAKNRVNLTCSVCARCGDEVLRRAENAVFGHVQMSECERA